MSNNLLGSTSYIQLAPSNHPSNSLISFKDGNPVINFILGEQDRYLIGSSVRLMGNLAVYKTPSGDHGDIPVVNDDLQINPKLGVYGMLDQVTISSQKSKNVIESVRHYGTFLASFLPNTTSKEEALGHLSITSGMCPNPDCQTETFVNNLNGSSATDRQFRGNSFCINIPTGFLMSKENINLSGKSGVGGLEFSFSLAPDVQFLNGSWTQAFYQLTDVNLVCEVINPSVDELSRMMNMSSGTMEYNAITSYYQTIQSSNAIINFRLGLSRVLSAYMTFIPSEFLNNLTYDGYQTSPLINDFASGEVADIKQVIFLRGGERVPLQYNLDTNARDDPNSIIADPQLTRNYMNSFVPFMKNMKTQQSPITNARELIANDNYAFADAGLLFGVGVAFDNISGQGLDFRTENFGVQMDTGLTKDVPHSAFLFVRSKQTLVFNENGLQVIS